MSEAQGEYRVEPLILTKAETVMERCPDIDDFYQTKGWSNEPSAACFLQDLIRQLRKQSIKRLRVNSRNDFVLNVCLQVGRLNNVEFTRDEWMKLFFKRIASPNDTMAQKTARILGGMEETFVREDGTTKKIRLIDKQRFQENRLQFIDRFVGKEFSDTRQDIVILVNGLPMVRIEIKEPDTDLRGAFQRIDHYRADDFLIDTGVFDYTQIFVLTNGKETKYFSNSVRAKHIRELNRVSERKPLSSGFSFTSWWADASNRRCGDLAEFASTFLVKRTVLNMLFRYCRQDGNGNTLVLRPYQIVAIEQALCRVRALAKKKKKKYNSSEATAHVSFAPGTGNTLSSFTVARLARGIPELAKIVLVVSDEDLAGHPIHDYPITADVGRGSLAATAPLAVLEGELEAPGTRFVITTSGRLSRYLAGREQCPLSDSQVFMVFDDCPPEALSRLRGEIFKVFKRCQLCAFASARLPDFGDCLHEYSITAAIDDGYVLPWNVDCPDLAAPKSQLSVAAPAGVSRAVQHVLSCSAGKGSRHWGYSSLLAADSSASARRYYAEFQRQQEALKPDQRLKLGLLYGGPEGDSESGSQAAAEPPADTGRDAESRKFLVAAMTDYRDIFGGDFDLSPAGWLAYCADLRRRLARGELDVAIVVDSFLADLDAPMVTTLWLDRELEGRELLRAVSRVNRVFNEVKAYGSIVCLRDVRESVTGAFKLLGDEETPAAVQLKPYVHYYRKYLDAVAALWAATGKAQFPRDPEGRLEFARQMGIILRTRHLLATFREFQGDEVLPDEELQEHLSTYLDVHMNPTGTAQGRFRIPTGDSELAYEIPLIEHSAADIRDILAQMAEYLEASSAERKAKILEDILRQVGASPWLHGAEEFVERFLGSASADLPLRKEWPKFVTEQMHGELMHLSADAGLHSDGAKYVLSNAFRAGEMPTEDIEIRRTIPPLPRFRVHNSYGDKKGKAFVTLRRYFNRYANLADKEQLAGTFSPSSSSSS